MPSQGYATIGLKPAILSKLQKDTDEFYPGMFLPSALIIMMNEVKRGYYSVEMQNVKADFSGRYTSLTIRSDVKGWLEESYERLEEDYDRKYKAKHGVQNFEQFTDVFLKELLEKVNAAKRILTL